MSTGVEELLKVLPRFVDRTRRQAAFTRSLAGLLACVAGPPRGGSDAAVPVVTEPCDAPVPDPVGAEPVDVLGVVADGAPAPADPAEPATQEAPEDRAAVPEEAELGIQDYDSLAASQVVPRLATLTPEALRAVQTYERSHRHRQTILNRVAQLLGDR